MICYNVDMHSVDTAPGFPSATSPEAAEDFALWEQETFPRDTELSLEEILAAEQPEPQRAWAETSSNNIVTEEMYSDRLAWRIGQAGHALDIIRDSIATEDDAMDWTFYKIAVAEMANGPLYDGKSTDVNRLADEIAAFVKHFDFDHAAWQRVANR